MVDSVQTIKRMTLDDLKSGQEIGLILPYGLNYLKDPNRRIRRVVVDFICPGETGPVRIFDLDKCLDDKIVYYEIARKDVLISGERLRLSSPPRVSLISQNHIRYQQLNDRLNFARK